MSNSVREDHPIFAQAFTHAIAFALGMILVGLTISGCTL